MKIEAIAITKLIQDKIASIFYALFALQSVCAGLGGIGWNLKSNKNLALDKSIQKENANCESTVKIKIPMRLIIIILLFLFSCTNHKSKDKSLLLSLLTDPSNSVRAYFSYPGRYTEVDKKRSVLEKILAIIDGAKFSLKIYAYSLNNTEVIESLKEASKRGVKVDIVGDSDQNYDLLKENGFIVNIWKQSGLHHIKVIVADNQIFFTGTGNFSRQGLTNDWNGYIQVDVEAQNRSSLADFLNENLSSPVLNTNGISFIGSPENGFLSQDLLLEQIEAAKFSIEYLIFDHFDALISHALKKASARGVAVTGIYDAPLDDEGEYLRNEFYGINSSIYKDGNEDIIETNSFPEGGLLHHKSIIIDGKVLLSGSYNYSKNARDSNRELLFKTENAYLVSEFQKEFIRVKEKSYLIPANRFYSSPIQKQLESSSLKGDTLCLPDTVTSPVIELGSGIWKTYLYYPKLKNANCFLISSYETISSGLTHGSRSDFLSLNSIWDFFQVFDRNSNVSYEYGSPNPSVLFHSRKKIIKKNSKYLSFTSSRIYFEMKEVLPLAAREIQVWIPGKGMRISKVEQPVTAEQGFTALIPTSSSERSYAGVFIDTLEVIYFFCFQERTKSNRDSFDYLLKQIYMENDLKNASETGCVRND